MKNNFRNPAALAIIAALLAAPALAQFSPGTSPLSGPKGGTANAFMQFTGPASSLKTFTLPNASDTIATLAAIQTFTAAKTFASSKLLLAGSSSGAGTLNAPAAASSFVWTLPALTDTLVSKTSTDTLTNKTFDSAGAGNSLLINGLAASANTGTGAVVRATSPAITTPTGIVKGDVGLGSVDNTSDATKNAAAVTLTNKTIDTASNTFKLNGAAFGTATQATAALNNVVGDSGSGGTKGLVPAAAAGDGAAGKYLAADGTYSVPPGGSGLPAGTKAQQQAGTSNAVAATPLHQQDHDSAAKVWLEFVGGSTTISAGYNVSSITNPSTGNYTINFTTAFASASYSCQYSAASASAAGTVGQFSSQVAGSIALNTFTPSTGASANPSSAGFVVCYGRQ